MNELELDAFTPVVLSDGDVIKIGELTSIVVELEDVRVEVNESDVRRNPRQKGWKLEVIDSTNELRLGKEDESKGKVRDRNKRGKVDLEKIEVAEVKGINEVELARSKRVTRNTARKENGAKIELLRIENLGRRDPRRRKGRKKEENEVGGMAKDHHNLWILSGNGLQNCEENLS